MIVDHLINNVVALTARPASTLGSPAVRDIVPSGLTKYFFPGVKDDSVVVFPITAILPDAVFEIAAFEKPIKFSDVMFEVTAGTS